jgi:hypothetical protein
MKKLSLKFIVLGVMIAAIIGIFYTNKVNSEELAEEELTIEKEEKQESVIILNSTINNMRNVIEDKRNSIEQEESEEYTGTLEQLQFIVEVTGVEYEDESTVIYGITADKELYSGEIEILMEDAPEIELYETYIFTTRPMITMSNPPIVTALSCRKAIVYEKAKLQRIKKETSNYLECELLYEDMTLDEIIQHGNNNYYTWTDDDIIRYQGLLESLGYNSDYEVKSNVFTVTQLSEN